MRTENVLVTAQKGSQLALPHVRALIQEFVNIGPDIFFVNVKTKLASLGGIRNASF